MAKKSGLEEALEYLINEDQEKAAEAFHNFIVGKARDIHESLIEDDELDEALVDEKADEEVDESDDSDEEQVDEGLIDSEEYFGGSELAAEADDEMEPEMGDEMGDPEADLGDEMGGEEAAESGPQELADALADLTAKFEEVMGIEVGDGDGDEDDMGMDMEPEMGDDMGMDMEPEMDAEPAEESYFESKDEEVDEAKDEEVDESDDKEEVDEAVTHDAGVAEKSKASTDHEGKHSRKDSLRHNEDAKLPEAAEFDFDLTEEDFMDLEEGLKAIDVKMGGEQGGTRYAGEETNTKSPVAKRDKSDIKADPKTMVAKQDEHGTYDRESAPGNDMLPHSGDNSHESMDKTGSPGRSEEHDAGGLEAQKSHKAEEQGGQKYAGTETNVKSPIGSAGTRNETGKSAKK